jgi:hypothetical protein
MDQVLTGISVAKIRSFAQEVKALDIAELKDYKEPQRLTLMLCLVQRARVRTRDDIAEMFLRRMRSRHLCGSCTLFPMPASNRQGELRPVRWLVPVLAVFAGSPVIAQSRDVKPQFEVASIKRCVGPQPPARLSFSSGRLHLPCWGLLNVIQDAYQIYADGKADFMIQPPSVTRFEGFPEQMSSDRYTIDAKAESPQGTGMMRGPMMQGLLEIVFT